MRVERGGGAALASPPPPSSTLFCFYYAERHTKDAERLRPGAASAGRVTAGLCHRAAAAPNEQQTEQKRSETGWSGGQSYVTCGCVRVHLRSARHLQLNSAGPATSTSAEQPAASPPLLPSITNSFLSSFPPSFLSRILSLSVLPAYSPYARARSGNYGNGSNVNGHAHQQLFWLHEWEARAPLFPNFFL